MRADELLRIMGRGITSAMERRGVPSRIIAVWSDTWMLYVADAGDGSARADETATAILQSLAVARTIYQVYSDE